MNDDTIGKRLKCVSNIYKLTYKDVANDIGISYTNIVRYFNDIRIPSDDILYKFCEKYNIDFVWILFGKGNLRFDIKEGNNAYKYIFIPFVRNNKLTIISFLNRENAYKEPIVIKQFRNMHCISRSKMERLMYIALKDIR